MTIKRFDRQICKKFSDELSAELTKLATKYGVKVIMKGGKFSETTFTPKIEFATIAENGQVCNSEAEDFKHYAAMYGVDPTSLGKFVTMQGKTYKVVGLRVKAHKKPIVFEHGGKTFTGSADILKRFYPLKESA